MFACLLHGVEWAAARKLFFSRMGSTNGLSAKIIIYFSGSIQLASRVCKANVPPVLTAWRPHSGGVSADFSCFLYLPLFSFMLLIFLLYITYRSFTAYFLCLFIVVSFIFIIFLYLMWAERQPRFVRAKLFSCIFFRVPLFPIHRGICSLSQVVFQIFLPPRQIFLPPR